MSSGEQLFSNCYVVVSARSASISQQACWITLSEETQPHPFKTAHQEKKSYSAICHETPPETL